LQNPKILIENSSNPSVPILNGLLCKSFLCRLKGLMFQRSLPNNFGLLLADSVESRVNSAIHMFFMNFDIAVIWIDKHFRVVDVQIAQKGHALYSPSAPAQYTLETSVENFGFFHPGDQIKVDYVD
jgi:uncharacterized membrane protein (UPF0127 family)